MEQKNLGLLTAPPRQTDYILGISSPLTTDRLIKDWSIYLPGFESQRNTITDFYDCVTMSMIHSIEMQLNYLMSTNQLSDEALYFFYNNGYIVNGCFDLSVRFNAKINGTDITKGQYLNIAGDSVRKSGFLPNSNWPMSETMSDTLYYTDIPIGLFSKAIKVLWFIDIKYQWVNKSDFSAVLQQSPIQVATELCSGWDSGNIVQKCSGQPLQHATLIYRIDELGNYSDLDHYPPYLQKLSKDYELPLNMEYIVTMKPITLRNGMHGSNVLALQKNLNKLGFLVKEDSDFGPKTQTQIISFQNKTGLVADGVAGPITLTKLKELTTPKNLVDVIIQVESGGDDMAEGDKTLQEHAYGCLQIRQGVCDDVNKHFGTTYKSKNCLGNRSLSLEIWNKYWEVYVRPDNEDKSRSWNGGPNWKQIYFKPNKTPQELQYCKNLDIYWKKVEALLK